MTRPRIFGAAGMNGPAPVVPKRAMVLAAGRGERMRPLTEDRPKALVEVHGRALIDHVLDHVAAAGVETAVVNLFHFADKLRDHLAARQAPRLAFSPEEEPLETGGGVNNALPLLGDEAFYVVNGDVIWLDGILPALGRLAQQWDESRMDALLLLHPAVHAMGYDGAGDFIMDPAGRLRRRKEREVAPFVFAGVQILHPRLFAGAPDGAFSLNRLYDRAIGAERLWGLRHDGEWYHVGTPQALQEVESSLHPLIFKNARR